MILMVGKDPKCQGCKCGTCIENPVFGCNFECQNCCMCNDGERLKKKCDVYFCTTTKRFSDMIKEGGV